MSSLLSCKNPMLLSAYWRRFLHSTTELRTPLGSEPFFLTRSFSSVEPVEGYDEQNHRGPGNSFIVSYLVNSCGLSLESAKSKSKGVKFDTTEKPDSVLRLLKNYGFSVDQITRVVKSCPRLLMVDAESILLPKLEFLGSIGFSSADSAKLISSCPVILSRSLDKALIPCYNFLKSVLAHDEIISKCLKHSNWLFLLDVQKDLAPKVSILRGHGVPHAHIELLFRRAPRVLSSATNRFDEIVKKVIKLGFDHTKGNFVQAVVVICQLSESNWEHRIKLYKRLGWSENDVYSAFKKFPNFMSLSEKKFMSGMDFFANKLGLQPSDIAKNPMILSLSLEKTIIPRYLVISALVSKGILKEDVNYTWMLASSQKRFMDKFVIKYQNDVPQLLSMIQGEKGPQELVLLEKLVG